MQQSSDNSENNRQKTLEEVGRLCRRIGELEREVEDQRALVLSLRETLEKTIDGASGDTRRELIEQLRKGQKMEALGLLAGGIAHDMNNILGAIMSLASVLRKEFPAGDRRHRDADDILTAARRGRDLTRNLLGFAREGKNVKSSVSLNDVAKEALAVMSRTLPKTISWNLDLDEDLPSTEGDFGQMAHAVMNVCINAVEAMPNGGELTIGTRKVYLGLPALEHWPHLAPGTYILLRVRDTGIGMDEETRRRVFEPFFSTKPRDEATGLGLSMVFGTVTNHGGKVEIESAPQKGTTVSLYFPRAKSTSVALRQTPLEAESAVTGSYRVLVVDDERIVRRAARRSLEQLGHSVVEARNGMEAISVMEGDANSIDLILLDVVMPKMGGVEAFPLLRRIRSDVPILISSGYSRTGDVDELVKQGAVGFIEKPYDIDKLSFHLNAAMRR